MKKPAGLKIPKLTKAQAHEARHMSMKAPSIVSYLRVLENLVIGPRDWYHIDHCKTGAGKPYFSVRVCVWNDDWPVYGDGESVYLARAIQQAILQIEDTQR
jgi:hypothetical protein